MEPSLLTTKLLLPLLRSPLVPRPRLVDHCRRAGDYALTLVSAPAGFGKTTLLGEWVEASEPRPVVAWLSLDEGDNDPFLFWRYVIAALRTRLPETGVQTLERLGAGQPASVRDALTDLLNDLAHIGADFFLVLDDYHFIRSLSIHEDLSFMLEHLPPRMHLVIATRLDPPLPLPRFRGRGQMQELRAVDLRLTPEELAGMVRTLGGPPLGTRQLDALYARTEGWVTGLKMAMLTLRDCQDLSRCLADLMASPRYLMDYLIEEVVRHQPEDRQEFLMKTSVLDWLTGPLCDAVTGRTGGRETLRQFEQENLFIVSLDSAGEWYRYEHLFADLLRHQLETAFSGNDIREVHLKACRWYEDHGYPDASVRHAIAARDWEQAVRLISVYGKEKTGNGEFVTVYHWLQQLPQDIRLANSAIRDLDFLTTSWAGKPEAAAAVATDASGNARDEAASGEVDASDALIAWRRLDYRLAGELAEKALALLPADDVGRRSSMKNMLGWLAGLDFGKAGPLFTEAYRGALEVGDGFLAASAAGGLMKIALLTGQLRRVVELARTELERTGTSPAGVVAHFNLSYVYYEWNDLEKAVVHLRQAIALGRSIGPMQLRVQVHDMMARIELARGNEAGFLQALQDADAASEGIPESSEVQTDHAAYRLLFALWRDEPFEAATWGSRLGDRPSAISAVLNFVRPSLLLRQGKRQEAVAALEKLYAEAAGVGATYLMVKYRLCQARAVTDETVRLRLLTEALTAARTEGYVRTFVDDGPELVPLLRQAIRRNIEPGYVRGLLHVVEAEQHRSLNSGPVAPTASGLLSDRELEVLRLVAQEMSNPRIADRLNVSLATVKTHVHHVIGKLEVGDRRQAVYRARELGFL